MVRNGSGLVNRCYMKTENKALVIEFLEGLNLANFYPADHLANTDFDTAEDVREILDDNGAFTVEIIYYSNAMKYLSENDPSLNESLGIAAEYGYSDLTKINSELLASLLASQNLRESFEENFSDLEDFIASLDESEDEEAA